MMDTILNEMAINAEDLEAVNGGQTVKCYLKKTTTSLATLRAGSSQSSAKISMLPAGTKVLGSDLLRKDKIYTFRFCYVPGIKKSGWIADSLLR